MNSITENLNHIHSSIYSAVTNSKREENSVKLLCVSKTKPKEMVIEAYNDGERHFGESYAVEASEKIEQLKELGYNDIVWHFIGPIQKNKTKLIATHFDIVESVDRVIVAKRLDEQRPDNLKPLEVLIQVNISDESQKAGCAIADIDELIKEIQSLKKLKLRGFMGIGKDTDNRDEITEEFAQFKSEMTHEQYHKLEDTLMTLPLDYKNVSRIIEGASQESTAGVARRLLAPSLATAEHVLPHSLGGSNKASNFLSECAGCNNPRSSMPYAEWFKIHPEFKRNAQVYIEHVEGRIVNGELPTKYDSYPVDIRETLTNESDGQIVLKVLDKAKLIELREMKKAGQEVDIHAETEKAQQEEEKEQA